MERAPLALHPQRYRCHREAALALLSLSVQSGRPLQERQAQFLGHAIALDELTERQAGWLRLLLDRAGLPDLEATGRGR